MTTDHPLPAWAPNAKEGPSQNQETCAYCLLVHTRPSRSLPVSATLSASARMPDSLSACLPTPPHCCLPLRLSDSLSGRRRSSAAPGGQSSAAAGSLEFKGVILQAGIMSCQAGIDGSSEARCPYTAAEGRGSAIGQSKTDLRDGKGVVDYSRDS